MTADEEADYYITSATTPLNKDNSLLEDNVIARLKW
jgi:hypothetical protein